MAKDQRIELLVTAEQRASYEAEANRAGISLSAWLRQSADETVALVNALETQVADERARQERRRREDEEREQIVPASVRSRRAGPLAYPRRTIGDALREADANAGFTRPAR